MNSNRCPRDFYCSDGSPIYSAIDPSIHYFPAYIALVSSSFSLIGATLNMIAYCAFKDIRRGTAQTIVAVLAIADFLLALSVILGVCIQLAFGTNTYTNDSPSSNKDCYNFDTLCQIQAFITTWTLGCCFAWTSVLAIHFLLVTSCIRSAWPHKLMPLYNIVAWLVPLSYTLPILLLGKFGYTPLFTWTCFEASNDDPLIEWDILEMATVVAMVLAYICVLFKVLKLRRQIEPNLSRKVSNRMLTILFAYALLRVSDLGAIITNIIAIKTATAGSVASIACSSRHIQIAGFVFSTVMAVADPGQGWINCILYIILSPELRKRMFVRPFQRLWRRLVKKTAQRQQGALETQPLLGNTTDALSVPASGTTTDKRTHTYLSFPTEFP